ncbi:MAG: beta strand repeat-containing protein, partial [Hominicoprocola sp.]
MKRRIGRILLALCLCLSLLPTVALAVNNVSYLDASGASQTCDSATEVTSSDTNWSNGWYVVNSDVTIDNRITVSGTVHLILADGCTLTAQKGIQVQDNDSNPNNGSSNALTIYGQAGGTGRLNASAGNSGNAGIGGNGGGSGSGGSCGTITINGGTVTANGGCGSDVEGWGSEFGGGAGIGGGFGRDSGGSGGTVTINGGTVTATGGAGAVIGGGAGIGGGGSVGDQKDEGFGGSGGSVTINGGTVTAIGGTGAQIGGGGAGIGGGFGYHLGGSGGTFQTTDAGNAVIFASSIADKNNQSSWSGVIFEGNEGKVYGTAVTPVEDFTIDSGKTLILPAGVTLTIPEGVTLTINGAFNNSGKLYVGGTVKENIYYLLTVNGGTASTTETHNGKTYARAGSTITLTPNASSSGQAFDHWEATGASISGDRFTMPAGPVTVTARYAAGLTITAQPTGGTIPYGQTITLSVAVSKPASLTGALDYQWYKDGTAISGATGSSYTTPTTLAAGNHTYSCVITCGSNTVTSSTATVTVNPLAEATPVIAIDYENETLTGFVLGSSYTIDDTEVMPVNGELSVTDYLGSNISIVTTASDGNHAASTAQTLNIPARPAKPSPVGVNETVNGKTDGQITGVDNTMEYRKGAEGNWTDCAGTAVTGLAPGTYQVRVKATGTSFASLAADVTIATGSEPTYTLNVTAPTFAAAAYGYTQPVAQDIIITSSGNWQSTITGVTVDSTDFFTIGGSGDTVAAGGYINTRTVQPAADLAAGFYTATITVTYNNDATATAPVSFTVTRAAQDAPAAPTVKSKTSGSVTLEEIPDNANGAKAQYSMDGGTTWQDSPEFTGLSAGTEYGFAARYGATDNYFASPVSAELKVTTNAAPSGGSGVSTYAITVDSAKNGTVTVSPKSASKGTTVTITVEP